MKHLRTYESSGDDIKDIYKIPTKSPHIFIATDKIKNFYNFRVKSLDTIRDLFKDNTKDSHILIHVNKQKEMSTWSRLDSVNKNGIKRVNSRHYKGEIEVTDIDLIYWNNKQKSNKFGF